MRRLRMATSLGVLGSLLMMLGPLVAAVAPAPAFAQAEITCEDFVRQEAAQALLDADESYADALDPDGDGVACNEEGDSEAQGQDEAAAEDATAEGEATVEAAGEGEPTSGNPLRGRFGG